jgi:arabinose-5-phosphate isomerase
VDLLIVGCIGVVANTDGGEGLARMTNESEIQETRVEDVMHYGLITCRTQALLKEVVRIIADTEVHALVALHDNGSVAGIVSHMDLLRLYGQNLLEHKAEDVMTPTVITIGPEATVKEAVDLMLKHNIRRLLVTEHTPEGERPIGVISTTDVIRDMREQPWFW